MQCHKTTHVNCIEIHTVIWFGQGLFSNASVMYIASGVFVYCLNCLLCVRVRVLKAIASFKYLLLHMIKRYDKERQRMWNIVQVKYTFIWSNSTLFRSLCTVWGHVRGVREGGRERGRSLLSLSFLTVFIICGSSNSTCYCCTEGIQLFSLQF